MPAADLRRSCASRGIVASTIDCQIAAAAIQNRCALLTTDEDFDHIARVSKLKLVKSVTGLLRQLPEGCRLDLANALAVTSKSSSG